jgi:hypothetical protein
MTCKLYNGRVLVIFLVIFALPRQTPIGPDLFTDTVTVWRDHRHASAGWPSSCNGLASSATHPGVRTWEASQEARPQVVAASPGHPRVGLLRLLRPQPFCPAGRAALWRARSLLNHDLHPITLM